MYDIRGKTGVTSGVADHAIAQLWNPHATQRVKVIQIGVFKSAAGTAGDSFRLRRTSARGTAPGTVTGVIAHHSEYAIGPGSGALLDLGPFSVQPTLIGGDLGPDWIAAAFAAAGLVYAIPGGIVIPPLAGLALIQAAATIWPISGITYIWLEDW